MSFWSIWDTPYRPENSGSGPTFGPVSPEQDKNGKLRFFFKDQGDVAGAAGDAGAVGAAGAAACTKIC